MESDIKWYVLRVRYGQGQKASITLKESGIEIYYPPHKYKKWVDGRLRTIVEPLLPSFIFVHSSIKALNTIFNKKPLLYHQVRFFRDRTKESDKTGLNPPLFVEDKQMLNFQNVVKVGKDKNDYGAGLVGSHTRVNYSYKVGDMVRITRGPYLGVEGRVARIHGQQRIVVEIPGICRYATQYVATPLLEPIKD